MKKCIACKLVFLSDERSHCIYCNAPLVEASVDEISKGGEGEEGASGPRAAKLSRGVEYVAGNYFKAKSFFFLYALRRNELKMGKEYKRFFIYPLDLTFVARVPWIVFDIVDSFLFHMFYKGFCQECQWKHVKITAQGEHTPEQCAYNKEYSMVLNDILSGKIVNSEVNYARLANEKLKHGKRSAYFELCSPRKDFETYIDLANILISFGLFIYLMIILAMPIFGAIYNFEF